MNYFCKVPGCNNKYYAKGFCVKHYYRNKRNGDPLSLKMSSMGATVRNRYEYVSYIGMVHRCTDKKIRCYKHYGGRGIKVCNRWLGPDGFKHFLEDMGECPKKCTRSGSREYTLDRIDANGDYCPENCRWADRYTQALNRHRQSRKYSSRLGVSYDRNSGRWQARIETKGVKLFERYKTEAEAIAARERMERQVF